MPTYNGNKVSDLDATTPTSGTWTVPEADDAIREIKTVIKNECKVTVPGAYPYTILATDSYIHATGTVTVNFPQISAVSSATVRKEYVVANVGAGVVTMAPYAGDTLPITTLAAENVVVFWCNGGTTWYVKNNAINAINLWDGSAYRAASATPAANTVVVSNASGIVDYQAKHLAVTGEASATNAGVVTLSNLGGGIEITSLDVGSVTIGDRIQVFADVYEAKGTTGGWSSAIIFKKSGTATIGTFYYASNPVALYTRRIVDANQGEMLSCHGIVEVTGTGTLVLGFNGESTGSNASVAIGDGRIKLFFLKKQ